ncbi:steroid 5-alpha reductase family enzyme [Aquamicrobium lusatiense]|uniref:Steroid 5-alpha reductase family enzyme n=1 Tax=Aquamicrobium lusatiense TaxID=89772 RepID=A0A7W9S766_9HYPH|nr:DUF1295 domain-containing protein [Aquamicrobium lusatiense]MBB6014579.1 steroid 5-alpha reductase family enzyme [Aquamicrobium lusatiense]
MIAGWIAWLALGVAWRLAMPREARGRTWNYVQMLLPGVVLALAQWGPPGLREPLGAYLFGGVAVVVLGALGWALGQALRNHSIMDVVYPALSFGVALATVLAATSEVNMRLTVLLGLMALWMVRLVFHVRGTNVAVEQEPYASLRKRFGPRWTVWSFFSVYMLQGVIIWIWCAPFAFAGIAGVATLQPTDWIGVAVWLVGFAFQAVGDHQMSAFKADPANRGQIMDRGLWGYTRHPNYFGESLMWWGYFLFALVHPWGWVSVVGPLYVTWFMGWGSATPGNERHMRKTRGEAFEAYARRVPMFFPRLWRARS